MSDSPLSKPATDALLPNLLDELRARAAMNASARPGNKAALFDALAAADITNVVVEFDGSCDEGQIESVTAYTGEAAVDLPAESIAISEPRWGSVSLERRACPIAEAIEAMAYALLEEAHGGWENNDGAFGIFTFDVAKRAIWLAFNERVMESVSSEYEF